MANRLKETLRGGQTAYGLWATLESPAISEAAAELGIDWVCVDLEHGHLDYRAVLDHARAVHGSQTTILVRVPAIAQDAIKRVLDTGVEGILLPLVRSRAELELGRRYALYPPEGDRGLGGERAVRWGLRYEEYIREANADVLVIPLIETAEAAEAIDDILAAPGLEAIYFGPADLSARSGHLGQWEGPSVAERISAMREKAQRRGIAAGVNARGDGDAERRRDQGFAMVGLGSDMGLMIRETNRLLTALRGAAGASSWF